VTVELIDVVHFVEDMWPILIGASVWGAWAIAARRFERRRLREGTWDKHGPKHPTFAPPNPTLRAVGIQSPTIEREPAPGRRDVDEEPPTTGE
jgi:hypothetical protein